MFAPTSEPNGMSETSFILVVILIIIVIWHEEYSDDRQRRNAKTPEDHKVLNEEIAGRTWAWRITFIVCGALAVWHFIDKS
jgi:hypothetical protein